MRTASRRLIVGLLALLAVVWILTQLATWGEEEIDFFTGVPPASHEAPPLSRALSDPLTEPLSEPLTEPLIEPVVYAEPGEAAPLNLDLSTWETYRQSEQGWSVRYPAGWHVYAYPWAHGEGDEWEIVVSNKPWAEFEEDGCDRLATCYMLDYGLEMDWFYFKMRVEPLGERYAGCTEIAACMVESCRENEACQYPYIQSEVQFAPDYDWVSQQALECCNDPRFLAVSGPWSWVMYPSLEPGTDTFDLIVNDKIFHAYKQLRTRIDPEIGYPVEFYPENPDYLEVLRQFLGSLRVGEVAGD